MPRASRAEAQQHRQQVIDHTSRLIREKGADQVSVPQAMAAAGLTHGGFYRHFSSKDDLIAQALLAAFTERRQAMDRLVDQEREQDREQDSGQGQADRSARAEYLARYLSTLHLDRPGDGCPAVTLAADAARAEPGAPIRTAFTDGLRDLVDGFQQLTDGADAETDRGTALVELSTLVGAVLLARATDDADLSHEILDSARRYFGVPDSPDPAGM
ncbi:TetR/AcrR family transcriptional regulator [Kitasatospora aureofaciens]|uniref:TetR/AcrR family transcriptional regulator n=1 Tax=Kitasatospora aureofaciens TaxID=1894 RepID=UPI001C445A78|nr:TetR/AcrR family transcriptional regulator [Kitasatospora aureofaciens]MBV6700183.1 TetR/AcrR family transcriptional regulator [Kitasatospora aureofaciens]